MKIQNSLLFIGLLMGLGINVQSAVSSRVIVRGTIKNIAKTSLELQDARKNVFKVPRPLKAGPELRPGKAIAIEVELAEFVALNRKR